MSFADAGEGERVSLDELSTSAFAASNREGGPPDDRLPPQDVVNILAHLTLASAHPMLPVRSMTPAEIVSVVLDGTRKEGTA